MGKWKRPNHGKDRGVDAERSQPLARINGMLARLSDEDQESIVELVEVALGLSAAVSDIG